MLACGRVSTWGSFGPYSCLTTPYVCSCAHNIFYVNPLRMFCSLFSKLLLTLASFLVGMLHFPDLHLEKILMWCFLYRAKTVKHVCL